MHKENLTALLIMGLFIALTIFSGCATRTIEQTEIDETKNAIAPEVPTAPVMEAVAFADKDGGLWVSYNDYRALERNIIAMREYTARLKIIIDFYREVKSDGR